MSKFIASNLLCINDCAKHGVAFIDFSKLTKDQLQGQYLLQAVQQKSKTSGTLNT